MRTELKKIGRQDRHTYEALYGGGGFKRNYGDHYLPTLLLKNVKFQKTIVADHLWVNYTRGFSKLGRLKDGNVIIFDGRVTSYTKRYYTQAKQKEYGLERPTKIHLLGDRETEPIPDAIDDKNPLVGYIMKTNKEFYLANNRPYDSWYVEQYENWLNHHN